MRLRPARGSAPDPSGGAYSAPRAPSWIWGKEWEGGRKEEEKTEEGEGKVSGASQRGEVNTRIKILATALTSATRFQGVLSHYACKRTDCSKLSCVTQLLKTVAEYLCYLHLVK